MFLAAVFFLTDRGSAAEPEAPGADAPAAEQPLVKPPASGVLEAADQATVAAAVARLKRDLLVECLLSPADKKRLGKVIPGAEKSGGERKKGALPDLATLERLRDKNIAVALDLAEKSGKVPGNLDKQFQHGLGEETLVGLALVKAGVSPTHPLIRQIWADLQKNNWNPKGATYGAGVGLMLVEAMMHSPSGEKWPQDADEQAKVNGWVSRIADRLEAGGYKGGWGYEFRNQGHDHSNTQYAALGLKAARLCGWKPRNATASRVWDSILEHFVNAQEKRGPEVKLTVQTEKAGTGGVDYSSQAWQKSPGEEFNYQATAQARGWNYNSDDLSGTGTTQGSLNMTIAGLTAIILAQSESRLPDQDESRAVNANRLATTRIAANQAVRDGMAWVQMKWPQDLIDGYGLYGIERLGVLGNLVRIGGHDWYRELAPKVAAKVMTPGGVKPGGLSTLPCERAFYLLFLVRGTSSAFAGSVPADPSRP